MNDVTKNNLQEQELKASKQTINQLLGFPEDTAVEDYLNYQDSQTAVSMFSKVVPAGILGVIVPRNCRFILLIGKC